MSIAQNLKLLENYEHSLKNLKIIGQNGKIGTTFGVKKKFMIWVGIVWQPQLTSEHYQEIVEPMMQSNVSYVGGHI